MVAINIWKSNVNNGDIVSLVFRNFNRGQSVVTLSNEIAHATKQRDEDIADFIVIFYQKEVFQSLT